MKARAALFAFAAFLLAEFSPFAESKGKSGDVSLQNGLVKIEGVRASGAVLFYVVNGKKTYPAVRTSEYGQTNYISLFVGGKEYRFNKGGRCKYTFSREENALLETAVIPGVAEITSVYSLSASGQNESIVDCVSVRHEVKNLSGPKNAFTLKAVYNLCLGENRKAHFSTAAGREISSEYVFEPSRDEAWLISSDSQNAVEFELFGNGITAPKKAALANKDVIDLSTPLTRFSPGNSFDSLMSYNDSSLALFWPEEVVATEESAVYSYRILFSASGFQNSGRELAEAEEEEAASESGLPSESAEEEAAPQEAAAAEKSGGADKRFDTKIDSVDPAKLNAEYVQQLINHINSLEQSDPSLNRLKIQQLQTEVDEVLQVLRSRK